MYYIVFASQLISNTDFKWSLATKKSITPELIVVKLLNIIPANKTGACLQDT